MSNQWFKFYGGEYLSDAKIGRLTASERSCWITLLCMASMTGDGIIKFLSLEDLLQKSGVSPQNKEDWDKCQSILKKLSNMMMIDVDIENDEIRLINWEKRQEYTMTSTERSRKHREKQREIQEMQRNATQCNENATLEENRIEENRIEEKRVNTTSESKKTKKERLNSGYESNFESFWSTYPNKIAKGKAYEVFQLLSEENQIQSVSAIKNQVENNHFWKDWINDGKGGDSPPHPTTWLNQKRWEDNVVFIKREGKIKGQANLPSKSYG
jgi:hypothetical protein